MEPADEFAPLCENCGYNLTGLSGHVCPECGRPFNSNAPYVSRIPWAGRRETGLGRAYWRTVIEMMFRPRTFAREATRGSSRAVADSESFRAITLWLAAISAGIGAAGTLCTMKPSASGLILLVMSPVFTLFAWTYLLIASQVVQDIRLFSTEKIQRPMARVMLRYACAPLALTPVIVLAVLALLVAHSWTFRETSFYGGFVLILALSIPLLWWVAAFRLMLLLTGSAPGSMIEMIFFVPLGWGVVGFFWAIMFLAPVLVAVNLFHLLD